MICLLIRQKANLSKTPSSWGLPQPLRTRALSPPLPEADFLLCLAPTTKAYLREITQFKIFVNARASLESIRYNAER